MHTTQVCEFDKLNVFIVTDDHSYMITPTFNILVVLVKRSGLQLHQRVNSLGSW